jgi:hypothetical protein
MQRPDDLVAAELDGGVARPEVVGERRVLGVDVVLAAAELAVRPAVGAGLGTRELRAGQSFAAGLALKLGLRPARAVAELRELLADQALRVLLAVDAVVLGLQELRDLPLVGIEQFSGALLERVGDLRVRVAGELAGDALGDGPGAFLAVGADGAAAAQCVPDLPEVLGEDVGGPNVRVDLPGEADGERPARPFRGFAGDLRDTGPAGGAPSPARAMPPAPGTRLTGSRATSSANPPMLAAGPRTPAARRTSENRYLSLFWMPRLSARRRSAAALLPGAWTARISLSPPRRTSLSVSPATAWMGRVSWLRIARPGASRAARCLRARSCSSRRLVPPLARHARWSVIRSGRAGAARGLMDGGSVRPVTIACATRWR